MLVIPVRGVAGRFQGPGGERGGGAGHELRRLGLGKGPAFGDVQLHLPQGLGDPTCHPQWPRTLGKGRKRVGTTGRKSGAGKQIVGWKSRGGCMRLKGRISAWLGVRTTWCSDPSFWGLHKNPTHFEDRVGEASPEEEPAPRLSEPQLVKSFGSAHRPCPRGRPRTEGSSPVPVPPDPGLACSPLLLLFAKGAALWNRDKGPGSVAGTIVPAWGPSTRAASAARVRRGGGT